MFRMLNLGCLRVPFWALFCLIFISVHCLLLLNRVVSLPGVPKKTGISDLSFSLSQYFNNSCSIMTYEPILESLIIGLFGTGFSFSISHLVAEILSGTCWWNLIDLTEYGRLVHSPSNATSTYRPISRQLDEILRN